MKNVKIHFCKSNDIGGAFIRFFTFSHWNHVAIEIDGVVYESLSSTGVRKQAASTYGGWDKMETVETYVPDLKVTKKFLEDQVSKPYDWTALVALPFREDWHNKEKWFCSELVIEAMLKGKFKPIRMESYRVTPRDLRLVV